MSRIKDIDLIILSKVYNTDLLNICQVNKYFSKLCNNEHLWRNKLWTEYAKIYPEKGQTWKNMYLKLNIYMDKYKYRIDEDSIVSASILGHLEIVKLLSTLPHVKTNLALAFAITKGHLDVANFLSNFTEECYEYEVVQFLHDLDWVKKNYNKIII